ncbi:hypothetical protein [Caballeronia sp. LZ032]|uniref:hypothetical protein n=1 Tax=Caballeronia sp. LZ032 TaxID=3038565 RepID=UPI00285F91C0|nr:hypothetical protein [Caballeronia sp. LZ032]MDR5880533.1 hypothetical protein [Caballeronia sp. LZ032]
MKILRTILFLLLCAMLPLTGRAATGLAGDCPMQQSTAAHDEDAMSAEMPGCESMKSPTTSKAKGEFCKNTAQCQFASIYHPPEQTTISRPTAVCNQVVFPYAESIAGREPGGLWRPPRAI